jgi:hypothetical protein
MSGDQEQKLGVWGTSRSHMPLISYEYLLSFLALTLLTQINNLSKPQRVPDHPMIGEIRKLKPIKGFRFPRKGDPFSTSPHETRRGLLSVS